MSVKKIALNTFYFGVIPKLSMLINIMVMPLVTPYLTTLDYGVQGLVASYTGLLLCVAPLGMNMHLVNSYYEMPNHYHLYWGRITSVFLLSALICGLTNVILLCMTLPDNLDNKIAVAFFGSFQIFFFGYGMIAQHLYTLKSNPKPLVGINFVSSLIGVSISFVLIYVFRLGYWGLMATASVTSMIAFFSFAYILRVRQGIFIILEKNWRRLKRDLKIALPLVPHTLGFVLLTSSSRIVMEMWGLSYEEIGLFSHGSNMGGYIVIIVTALVTAVSPQMQVTYRNSDFVGYRRFFYLCQAVAILGAFLFCIWMPQIYDLLIKNEDLKQSEYIATLICFANVVFPFYTFTSTVAFIQRSTKELLWLVFVPGILNVIICSIFIPIWGFNVAIYSTIISYWSQLIIPFVIKYYNITVTEWLGGKYKIIVMLGLILFALIFGNLIKRLDIVYKIAITVLCIFIIYRVMRKCKIINFV